MRSAEINRDTVLLVRMFCRQLAGKLRLLCRTLGIPLEAPAPVHIRPHRTGDASSVTFLHRTLYSEEYALDSTFEGEVGRGIARFLGRFDPQRDGFWVAETDGHVLGAIAIVHRAKESAQLRWFILHPAYRGLGLGRELMT